MPRDARPGKNYTAPRNKYSAGFLGAYAGGSFKGATKGVAGPSGAELPPDYSSTMTDDLQTEMPPEAPALGGGQQQFDPSIMSQVNTNFNALKAPVNIGEKPGFWSNLLSKGQTGNDYRRASYDANIAQYNMQAREALQQQAKAAALNQLALAHKFKLEQDAGLPRREAAILQATNPLLIDKTRQEEAIKSQEAINQARAVAAFKANVMPEDYESVLAPLGRATAGGGLLRQNVLNATMATPDGMTAIARNFYDTEGKQGIANNLDIANTERINAEVPFIPALNEANIRKTNATAATEEAGLPFVGIHNVSPGGYLANLQTGSGILNRPFQQDNPEAKFGPITMTNEGNILAIKKRGDDAGPTVGGGVLANSSTGSTIPPALPQFGFPQSPVAAQLPPEYAPYASSITPQQMQLAPETSQLQLTPQKPYPADAGMIPPALGADQSMLNWLMKRRQLPSIPRLY